MLHFRRTLLASVALASVLVVALVAERGQDPTPDEAVPDEVFRFEKEDLVAFSVRHRPDDTDLVFRQVDGAWTTLGQPWRPSRSMVRRAAHQLHDLTARADVVEAEEADLARYGLGPDALEVSVELADGRSLRFAVGDPNPSSVSWYMRPLEGSGGTASEATPRGRVYVVKKSSMDFWRAPVEDFREDRVVSFDADDVQRMVAVVDGRTLAIERVAERVYRMTEPVEQPAGRDEVRRMLGRLSSLRAMTFVQDGHAALAPAWGLEPPQHTFEVWTSAAGPIVVHLGSPIAGDPPLRYAWIGGDDDQVVLVRDGLLESFQLPVGDYRDRELVPTTHEWDVVSYDATLGGETLTVARSGDEFRWSDGATIPGATPKRVAARAAELQAVAFFDDGVPPAGRSFGLELPWATVVLRLADGVEHRVELGERFPVSVTEPAPVDPRDPRDPRASPASVTREVDHQFARVDGGVVVEVDGQLGETLEDLFRERGRKADRDAEKHLPPE